MRLTEKVERTTERLVKSLLGIPGVLAYEYEVGQSHVGSTIYVEAVVRAERGYQAVNLFVRAERERDRKGDSVLTIRIDPQFDVQDPKGVLDRATFLTAVAEAAEEVLA